MFRMLMAMMLVGLSPADCLVARESLSVNLRSGQVLVSLDDGSLQLARDSGPRTRIAEDLGRITNFGVSDWLNGEGLALVVEVSGFDDSHTYWWLTIYDETTSPKGFRVSGQGRILENIEPLQILNVEGAGDSIAVTLIDPRPIPDSSRKLAFRYENHCARSRVTDTGKTSRLYFSEQAIQYAGRDAERNVWIPAPPTVTSPSVP